MSKLHEILSGKNINFLIGSGASSPIFKTLSLGNDKPTLEQLLSNDYIDEKSKKAIYYYYFKNWIKPMKEFDYLNCIEEEVIKNYQIFISKLIDILDASGNERPKRANIFTTNYDLLFENTFENILKEKSNCYFNDGSCGFISRTLNPQSYNLNISQSGYSDNFKKEIPTINLLKMHGSVSWSKKDDELIEVSYTDTFNGLSPIDELDKVDFINDLVSKIIDINDISPFTNELSTLVNKLDNKLDEFYKNYKKLAIINPNKWKFHETVFEQHYYQLIRSFSYELEKENTVLIVFAFSFADEHIREIFKRSLSNPKLQVIIICYSESMKKEFEIHFDNIKNISYYPKNFKSNDGKDLTGNFTYLNGLLKGDYNE